MAESVFEFKDVDSVNDMSSAMNACALKIKWHLHHHPTDPNYEKLETLQLYLESRAISFRNMAMKLIGEKVRDSVSELQKATAEATISLENISEIKQVISIATALLTLAGSVMAGQAHSIFDSVEALRKAVQTG